MKLGNHLKNLRKKRGLTQKQLADLSNVSIVNIGKYERGESIPRIENLNKIALALEVEPNELLESHGKYIKLKELSRKDHLTSNYPKASTNYIDAIDQLSMRLALELTPDKEVNQDLENQRVELTKEFEENIADIFKGLKELINFSLDSESWNKSNFDLQMDVFSAIKNANLLAGLNKKIND